MLKVKKDLKNTELQKPVVPRGIWNLELSLLSSFNWADEEDCDGQDIVDII